MFKKKLKPTGFLERPVDEKDYIAGASPIVHEVRVFDGNHFQYATDFELQKQNNFEPMDCVTQAIINSIQTQMNWMIVTDKMPQKVYEFLLKHNCLVNGKVQFSKKFIAILSETTKEGNYFTKVAQTIREVGLIAELMLPISGKTWNEFYNKDQITDEMRELGKMLFDKDNPDALFTLQYEWVVTPNSGGLLEDQRAKMLHELKHVPLVIAKDAHATLKTLGIDQIRWQILDSYEPFRKDREWNYNALWVLKVVVDIKPLYTEAEIVNAKFQINKMVKQHGNKYFFTPDIIEADGKKLGKAYMLLKDKDGKYDGSFKYGTAYGSIFRQQTQDGTIVPVGNDLWSQIKPAEIK